MPATCKKDLIKVTYKELESLTKLIAAVSADQAMMPDDDGLTIKDIIAHRAHWMALFLGWYEDGQSDEQVYFPARGYKWNELKRYNSDLRDRQRTLGWAQACVLFVRTKDRYLRLLDRLSDSDLYGGPMKGARNAWTTGRWAEAAGASHFRSASKYIRARLRALRDED